MKHKVPQQGTLLTTCVTLLKQQSTGGLMETATRADVPIRWLRRVRNGTILQPGVDRIQRVYEQLSGRVLDV